VDLPSIGKRGAFHNRGPWARLAPYGFILLWSSSFITARVGLALVSPLLFVAVRLVAAAALLGLFLAVRGESLAPHAVWTLPAIAAVAWNVFAVSIGAMALYYYMLNRGAAGRVAANFYLIPGTVALLGWAVLGEHLTALAALGFVVASIGVFLVARQAPTRRGEVCE